MPMINGCGMADLILSDRSYSAFSFLVSFWAVYLHPVASVSERERASPRRRTPPSRHGGQHAMQ